MKNSARSSRSRCPLTAGAWCPRPGRPCCWRRCGLAGWGGCLSAALEQWRAPGWCTIRERSSRTWPRHWRWAVITEAIGSVPADAATPAYDSDGQLPDGGWLADITGLLNLDGWPAGMRVIVRKERPHPAEQLRFADCDGRRFITFAADAKKGQLAVLKLRRRRARCEDRSGTRRKRATDLPLKGFAQNQVRDRRLRAARLEADARPCGQRPPTGAETALAAHHVRRPSPGQKRRKQPQASVSDHQLVGAFLKLRRFTFDGGDTSLDIFRMHEHNVLHVIRTMSGRHFRALRSRGYWGGFSDEQCKANTAGGPPLDLPVPCGDRRPHRCCLLVKQRLEYSVGQLECPAQLGNWERYSAECAVGWLGWQLGWLGQLECPAQLGDRDRHSVE